VGCRAAFLAVTGWGRYRNLPYLICVHCRLGDNINATADKPICGCKLIAAGKLVPPEYSVKLRDEGKSVMCIEVFTSLGSSNALYSLSGELFQGQ
jgi:hypothetical protein